MEDGSDTGFKLQLGVDEAPKNLGMSRELNVAARVAVLLIANKMQQ